MLRKNGFSTRKDKRIFYYSPYLPNDEKFKKYYSPAAQSKSEYIRSVIKDLNVTTVCINCSLTVDDNTISYECANDNYGRYEILFSKVSHNRKLLPLCGAIMLFNVLKYTLFNVKKGDTIILYHSIYYDFIVRFLKKIKKYNIVYEVEEIYADVREAGKGREKEIKKCNNSADGFIFPTEMLDEIININHKPNVIIYGAYNPCDDSKNKSKKTTDEKIIVVYSGTLMEGKGASQAIECSKYLDDRYDIRIIGYGSEKEIDKVKELIENNNSQCQVKYDGMKYGKEYTEYLLGCDIGLCIQPLNNNFNVTTFPSKILNYLNHGLKVVATEMETLTRSKLADCLVFTENSDPEKVADAIKKVKDIEVMSNGKIKELSNEVFEKMHILLNNIS